MLRVMKTTDVVRMRHSRSSTIIVRTERYQLPTTEEIQAKLSGSTVFTSLDAASGFWWIYIYIYEDSSLLTTFIIYYYLEDIVLNVRLLE